MATKRRKKNSTQNQKRVKRSVRTERSLMKVRQIKRMMMMCLIWFCVIVYAVCYLVLVYEKDLRLVAPNVYSQLHEENFIPVSVADGVSAALLGRFSIKNLTSDLELQQDFCSFNQVMNVVNNRADLWRNLMIVAMFVSVASTLLMHIAWRMRCNRVISPSREVQALRSRYLNLLVISVCINCFLAALLYRFGYEGYADVSFRQMAYNVVFLLSPLAMILSTRFTAPMCVSGYKCCFH